MTIYFEEHLPKQTQYRKQRRAEVSGAIVVHTAENTADRWPPDGGAEGVAKFIRDRSDYGSYHEICDSDSHVQLGRYEWEMFGEGTGGNRWALHLSAACMAGQWPDLPVDWVAATGRRMGERAAVMAAWVKAERGITVPAKRITRAEYHAQQPGITTHALIDPKRRSDPGEMFPWGHFWEGFEGSEPTELAGLSGMTLTEAMDEVREISKVARPDGVSKKDLDSLRVQLGDECYRDGGDPWKILAKLWRAARASSEPVER